MPGFNLSIGNFRFPSKKIGANLNFNSIESDGFTVNNFTIKKFENDKLFVDCESCLLVLEGVILNKATLLQSSLNWEKTVINLYQRFGETFFSKFRGSFSGFLFDKTEKKWIIFTDQLGTKQLFYTFSDGKLLLSSEISDLYKFYKFHNLDVGFDEQAGYMLLSYGYMLDDHTLSSKIKKLEAGKFIKFDKDQNFSINTYYKLPKSFISNDYDQYELIEELDKKFQNAIELQFEKDKEYGYQHLVGLSGGLDSRMTSWVAHEMGYTDQVNFTFSQTNYLDETIAKKISTDLRHEWIFKALDNGIFLKDIDRINQITGGNVLYYGLAHGNSLFNILNFNNFGIVHTGQLGDVIIGSYIKNLSKNNLNNLGGAYSNKFKLKVNSSIKKFKDFGDLELTMLYQRGINGTNAGLLAAQCYSETISPFYNLEFFEFCLSIPINLRINHNLYKKWVLKKYPGAADYIWESTKRKLGANNPYISYKGKSIPIQKISSILLSKLGIKKSAIETKYHMNPLDFWYNSNSQLKYFQDSYYLNNIDLLNKFNSLQDDCKTLFNSGNAIEKNQVLSLLSAYNLFFR
ncbi:asparagine synthetase B family protein [Cyclobacterium amurskyense]|uniref:asparagine synthase (glutamine-hydrolyzing) n=1 Tax=Cyclobacterium amurskyense TaxID=320787 RepID=A0A0H4PDV8_9BACT|nr:hypothetical protein [Cyclobacterium amurskyense]AKP52434.1 Asparagine synthase [Cyclobacterium amurskyense]